MRLSREKFIAPLLLALMLFGCLPVSALAEEESIRLLPVDESERDPSLQHFIQRMNEAVMHKEPERLVEMVAVNVYNGFKKPAGVRKFAEIWRIDAIDSEIWDVMDELLKLGGGFVRSEKGVQYCMPYVFTEFPTEYDIFDYGAVISPSATLMQEPSSGSQRLAELSYHIIKIRDWRGVPDMSGTEGQFWINVSTLDGQQGFLRRQDIRSPSEYSACLLQSRKGVWRLVSLFSQVD